jgi:hypothetical protein
MSEQDPKITAEENIQAEIAKAEKRRAEAKTLEDKVALPDFGILMENQRIKMGLKTPTVDEVLIDLALMFRNEPEDVAKKREAIKKDPEGEGKEIYEKEVQPVIDNITGIIMTAVSLASGGLIPLPPLAAIKAVMDIIKAFEENAPSPTPESSKESILL